MTRSGKIRGNVDSAAKGAKSAGEQAQNSKSFRGLVTVGLISYGVVHVLIAWLIIQLAWTGAGEASKDGALAELAGTGVGRILLWVIAVGLFALVLWQLFEAAWGHQDKEEGRKRTIKRLGSAGKAVVYASLGVSAVTTAISGSAGSGKGEETLTSRLMSVGVGRILVIAIGIAVIVVGGRMIYRGLSKKFTKDLTGGVSQTIIRLGQFGFSAKGVILILVGALFGWAALSYDPEKAGGMDDALKTLKDQAYGPILLTVIALGVLAFGIYCFAWSRNAKK